jgi:hypothetical protein
VARLPHHDRFVSPGSPGYEPTSSSVRVILTATLVAVLSAGAMPVLIRASQPSGEAEATPVAAAVPMVSPTPAASPTDPDPSITTPGPGQVRTDLLPGVSLTVVEVHPGVYRVLGDGVRDLSTLTVEEVFSGRDGSLWLRATRR